VSGNVSPDGIWKIVVEDNKVKWIKLTKHKQQFTIEEIVEATKNIAPKIWKE